MKACIKRYKRILTALALVALTACIGAVGVACTTAQAQSSPLSAAERFAAADNGDVNATSPAEDNYSRWLSEKYSSSVARCSDWLADMMTTLDLISEAETGYDELFAAAYDNGLIDDPEPVVYTALTRGYAASTIVKALGYEPRELSPIADVEKGDDLMTAAYYGYFKPDDEDMLRPDDVVTADEYEALLTELRRYMSLRGKRVLAFGDSIMYGTGNDGDGIADIIGEKYGMTVSDYSVSGATFGVFKDRSHIADQIREALSRNAEADIILLDGGTNDMMNVGVGTMTKNFAFDSINENTFSGGMEYSLALLKKCYPEVPILYIRAHNMDIGEDMKEERYGEYALEIAVKWSVDSVDLYNESGFDAEDEAIREKYTSYREKLSRADSIHPTALGYAEFYLPLICDSVARLAG